MLYSFHLRALVIAIAPIWSICTTAQRPTPSFTASIQVPKSTLTSGSAIRVDIALENQTDELLSVEGLRNGPRGSGILIWNWKNKALEPFDKGREKPDSVRPGFATAIPPRQKVTEFVNLANWFDLTTPGRYTIQVRKKDKIGGGWVESNKLMITIVPKRE